MKQGGQRMNEDWLTASQAAQIISQHSGKEVSSDYINQLVRHGKLTPRKLDERTNLYKREEVERIVVEDQRGKGEQKRKRTKQAGEQPKIMLIDSKYRSKKA
jgi:hypothetical protein